jgi:hypothetical protein
MTEPRVTICIPTWQSEEFIAKTLRCARNQTHTNLRVLVSIDKSRDRTEEICRRHAAEDKRVEVVAHDRRLGWAHNINHLLDNVESEYFFLYMHDDIIDARYVETLLSKLTERPDAASAQCDVLHVLRTGRQFVASGRPQNGPLTERVIAGLLVPGAPLRALIRTERIDENVRFASTSERGWQAHVPFEVALFASGPALHMPEILYWRPSGRKGGLVASSWARVPTHELIDDQRGNAQQCLALVDSLSVSPTEAALMRFAVYLTLMLPIRIRETIERAPSFLDPGTVSPALEFVTVPTGWNEISSAARQSIAAAFVNLIRVEAWYYIRRGSVKDAMRTLMRVRAVELAIGVPVLTRRLVGRMLRRVRPLDVPDDLRSWLSDTQ